MLRCFRCFAGLTLAGALLPAAAQTVEPKDATGWFQRASDQMNLRMPGSAPFHMKVAFHAFPGVELIKKPQILTGDGVYEETWLSPRQWRREVTLGSYHAIEVQSDRVRKMQASSDYEPSRVLMLLEGLLNPIPRNYVSPDLIDIHRGWNLKRGTAGNLEYMRISSTFVSGERGHTFITAYLFLANGLLVQSNESGLMTGWQDDIVFAGKVVPKHFAVQGAGQNLLTAEVKVEAAGTADPAVFELPGEQAEPGMTLRPLHFFEAKRIADLGSGFTYLGYAPSANSFRGVLDRHGVLREVEVTTAQDLEELRKVLDGFRHEPYHPAEIDGSPCEFAMKFFY
jgi:hypothetical protein